MGTYKRSSTGKSLSFVRSPVPLLAILAMIVSVAGCRQKESDEANPHAPEVKAVHPHVGAISRTVTGDGILTPLNQATVTARVSEPIKKFYVQRGSRVQAGELIAELESGDLEAAAIADRGAFEAAEGAYDTAIGSTIPSEVQHALLELTEAKRKLGIMTDALDNVQLMFTRGVTSGRTLEQARLDLAHAQSEFAAADAHYQDLLKRQNTSAAKIAKGELEVARGKKLAAENQLSYATIRSPIAGTVIDRTVSAGDTVAVGTPIATIADTSSLIAKVHIGQEAAQSLKVGAAASIHVPGVASQLAAKVTVVSPALDAGSTTVEVWLEVKNSNQALKAGTPVRAEIEVQRVSGAMLVPTSAVLQATGDAGYSVFVVGPDGIARRRTIEIGEQTEESTQVIRGLSVDDAVIVEGGRRLEDGVKVTVGIAGTAQ